jgi:hypothetical protein
MHGLTRPRGSNGIGIQNTQAAICIVLAKALAKMAHLVATGICPRSHRASTVTSARPVRALYSCGSQGACALALIKWHLTTVHPEALTGPYGGLTAAGVWWRHTDGILTPKP